MYTPDRWVIIKISKGGETLYKVLAGWSGSYLEGQSWKVNSGISKCDVEGNHILFHGHSGSIYKCHRKGYGANMIMGGIMAQLDGVEGVKVLSEEEAFSELKL